jgi:hypothetical protein
VVRASASSEAIATKIAGKKEKAYSVLDGPFEIARLPRLGWGLGASERYYAFSRELDRIAGTDKRRGDVGKRGCENAIRMATSVAIGRGSIAVDLQDIEWAISIAKRSIDGAVNGVEKFVEEYFGFPKFCQRVLEFIAAKPDRWCPKRELYQKFRKHSRGKWDLSNALEQLQFGGKW